jgi:hypothetical protein
MKRITTFALLLFLPCLVQASEAPTLVACAPGYPGSTEDAQPTLDSFAQAAAEAAGWEAGSLDALYTNVEEDGVARLSQPDAALALVPVPFYLKHSKALGLEPLAAVVQEGGSSVTWGLAARKGRVTSPDSLAGWEVAAMAGYAPDFVRGTVLGPWGKVPSSARIAFSPRVLSALRRAARGEDVAVIVDGSQAKALPALPWGEDLELVFQAPPVPAHLVCAVKDRLAGDQAGELVKALLAMHETDEGSVLLASMQIVRFEALDKEALEEAGSRYAGARE